MGLVAWPEAPPSALAIRKLVNMEANSTSHSVPSRLEACPFQPLAAVPLPEALIVAG